MRPDQGERNADGEIWQDGPESVEAVPGLHDLRREELARMGARRGGSRPFLREALERGLNFFDTADVYSQGASEEIVGRALKDFAPRHELVIATKVHGQMGKSANGGGLSRKHILEAIDHSLKRLGTDYVDLFQIHRFDPNTPMEETLEALNDVVRAGKALYIGASSMYAWQFAKMNALASQKGQRRSLRCRTTTISFIARRSAR